MNMNSFLCFAFKLYTILTSWFESLPCGILIQQKNSKIMLVNSFRFSENVAYWRLEQSSSPQNQVQFL